MEQEFEKLKSLMESFYSTKVGFPFQTQIVPACRLQSYEQKKLAFVMNKSQNCPSKMIGTLSSIGDFVSKRLLCCYFDEQEKQSKFLHLISAQFFDITHFLRPPAPKLPIIDTFAQVQQTPSSDEFVNSKKPVRIGSRKESTETSSSS